MTFQDDWVAFRVADLINWWHLLWANALVSVFAERREWDLHPDHDSPALAPRTESRGAPGPASKLE